ncbi:MAG: hypothetical protein J5620_02765, partial [Alphaproteobacteria bacterium]|nr:hypothetical protein [Alphaproteobacteria bacterium]
SKTRIYTLQNHKINYTGYLSRMFCIFFPTVSKSRISRVRETLRHSNQKFNRHFAGLIFGRARMRKSAGGTQCRAKTKFLGAIGPRRAWRIREYTIRKITKIAGTRFF